MTKFIFNNHKLITGLKLFASKECQNVTQTAEEKIGLFQGGPKNERVSTG
jgi:hypothetical protein